MKNENEFVSRWNELGQNFWNNRSSRQRWLHIYVLFPELLKIIKAGIHKEILDYGCGDGSLALFLVNNLPESNVLAYDIADEMRKEAQLHLGKARVVDDLSERKFDVICANMVIQAVEDPVRMLKELRSNLTADGRILVTVPHPVFSLIENEHLTTKRMTVSPSKRKDIYRYLYEETEKVFWDFESEKHWTYLFNRTIQTYTGLFFNAGFSIEQIREPLPDKKGMKEKDLYRINSELPKTMLFCLRVFD